MKTLRLVALVAVVALAYFAQYIFDFGTLNEFFPAWMLAAAPVLWRATRWLPHDMLQLAVWLTLVAMLGFGLLAPVWVGERAIRYRRMRQPSSDAAARQSGLLAFGSIVVASALALVAAWALAQNPGLWWGWVMWPASVAVFLVAGVFANRSGPRVSYATGYARDVNPARSWPALLALLAVLAALLLFDLPNLPGRVDSVSAEIGLQARRIVESRVLPPFLLAGYTAPSYAPVVAITWLTGDGLLGIRLPGVLGALGLVAGVWLVGTEVFRRVPGRGVFDEVREDDGRWMAFLAALMAGTGLAIYHFSRTPLALEGVALGTLAGWAMLRGLRTDSRLLLGTSGALVGGAWLYGPSVLPFLLTYFAAWGGVWLLERSWLTGQAIAGHPGQPPTRVRRGAGWAGFGYWVLGAVIVAAPLLGQWFTTPGAMAQTVLWPQGAGVGQAGWAELDGLWDNLRRALLGVGYLPDQSGLTEYGAHLLSSLLAPLLMLAIGALLLNLDTLVGWLLISWISATLLTAALTAPTQPYWPALLPLLPAAGLALAFVMDRMRVTLMDDLGTWSLQATVYLAVGVAAAAALIGWVGFYQTARSDADLASIVGRAVRDAPSDVAIVVLNGQERLDTVLQLPAARLIASDLRQMDASAVEAGAWPEELAAPARILAAPADAGVLPLMQAYLAGGEWQVVRNLRGDPLLYIYDLPADGE